MLHLEIALPILPADLPCAAKHERPACSHLRQNQMTMVSLLEDVVGRTLHVHRKRVRSLKSPCSAMLHPRADGQSSRLIDCFTT